MAAIISAVNEGRKAGVRRLKKHLLKTDMTPMVDLGFLLITFFVFTSSLSEPRAVHLNMPADGAPTDVAESTALTILLGKNDMLYYYEGNWEQAEKNNMIIQSGFFTKNGIREVIRQKQKILDAHPVNGEGREGLVLMIKAGKNAAYKNVIDALDEAMINGVKKYAVLKIKPEEAARLQ